MNSKFKKALASATALTMTASVFSAMAVNVSAEGAVPFVEGDNVLNEWKFDFGSTENVAEGYTGVSADTQYSDSLGYGFLGLENGFAQDARDDGWTMTQGYDLILENGSESSVENADDDWVATTTRTEKEQAYNSPIRFAMKSEPNTYYRVKINLRRADVSQDAKVSLFTEKRHQHLLDEPIPEEGLQYECSVYVHNNWSKNTYEYVDKMLNIVAAGDNVAVSSIEVQEVEQAKTLWILGDSTVCEQTAAIPYFALDHCQGVGSALAKYVDSTWAIVNEAESGLDAKSSKNHFNNFVNDIKPGDVVWFEFGHNDDKVSNDPSTNGYLDTLSSYYDQITEKGADLVVVSPIERDTTGQFVDGQWNYTLSHYTTAATNFVDSAISSGADNIAMINLNTACLDFLNSEQARIDALRADNDLASLDAATTRFYYYVSKYSGYKNDYTHPNDYGADNFASLAVNAAKDTIEAGTAVQADVLSAVFESTREYPARPVADEICLDGAAPNSYYPTQLSKVVMYEYPIIIKSVAFDEETGAPTTMTVNLVASEMEYSYGRGVIEIFTADGTPKGTAKTTDVIDAVSAETQNVSFDTSDVTFDAAAGDTFKAYVLSVVMEGSEYVDSDTVISTEYTEKDMVDIKEYLLQGVLGTENKEDFSSYGLSVGDTIIGKGGWKNPGGESFVYGEDGGVTYAHCATTGSATYYPSTTFLNGASVSSGQLYCRFDIRYISGTFNLYFTDGTALNNWPTERMLPVEIKKNSNNEIAVYLNGVEKCQINSAEWVTLALTIDLDYGTYTLNVNGQTYTENVASLQGFGTPVPAKIALMAFQNDKSTNEYDITNIVLATLNTAELPDKTLTVATESDSKGSVSISYNNETVEGTTLSAPKNSNVTAIAEAKEGWEFSCWKDQNGDAVSYSPIYNVRLFDDLSITAEFTEAEIDPITTYVYKEDFSTLTTVTLAASGWTSANAQGNLTIESDSDHGNYLSFAPGNANSRVFSSSFSLDEPVSSDYAVEFDFALTAGSGNAQDSVFSIMNDAALTEFNNYNADKNKKDYAVTNCIFQLSTTNSTTWTINGSDQNVEIPKGTWVHAKLNIGADDNVNVVITNGDTELYSGTVAAVGDTDLKGIHVRSGRYNGITLLDNVKVYTTGDEPEPTEDLVVGTPALTTENKVSVSVTNNTENDMPVRLFVASYDENGALISLSVSTADKAVANGDTEFTADVPTTASFKVMLWDSAETGSPIIDFVDSLALAG